MNTDRPSRDDRGFVLVGSPFTGPFVWSKVAAGLRAGGHRVAVRDVDVGIGPPLVLVGHSGAGSLLPALAAASPGIVGAIFVDALLPHPGRSWAETVPTEFVDRLRREAVAGMLKPWPEWWGEERMRELLPDAELRDEFVRACPAVSIDWIDEVMPDVPEPASVYVQCSATYASETAAAKARGWPVLELDAHHLAPLTDPETIADAVLRASQLLSP